MSLSRHFYDLIEVQNALAYCLIERKPLEACFWLLELIDSNESSIAFATMIEVYVVRYGCSRLAWLFEARQAIIDGFINPDKLIELCYGLATLSQENVDVSLIASSIVYIQDASSSVPPVRLIHDVHDLPTGTTTIEKYIIRCLSTDNIRAAFWAAHYTNEESLIKICNYYRNKMKPQLGLCFDAVRNLNSWSGLDYPVWTHILLSFMIIEMTHKSAPIITRSFDALKRPMEYIYNKIAEWDELIGRRSRRIYTIPRDSLYLSTNRGIMPYTKTTINIINNMGANPSLTYSVINECNYWREIFESHRTIVALSCTSSTGESHGCNTDDTWEAFCEWAFPDDIPDEWSAEEKAKSHGPGITNPGEQPMWRRYLRKWMSTIYMSQDNATSIKNNYTLLMDIVGKIELKPTNIWSIGKMLAELETLAYQKFVIVAPTFNLEDLVVAAPPLENEIIMMRQLDKLTI